MRQADRGQRHLAREVRDSLERQTTNMITTKKIDEYPRWVCAECGNEHGSKKCKVSGWHYGKCDVCHSNKAVTPPRDFGHFPRWFDVQVKKKVRVKK